MNSSQILISISNFKNNENIVNFILNILALKNYYIGYIYYTICNCFYINYFKKLSIHIQNYLLNFSFYY